MPKFFAIKLSQLQIAICVGMLWLASAASAQESFIRSLGKPPPGFEDLSATQTTEVDVYFDGEYLLSTFVDYDTTSVTIANPTEIVDAIPTLLEPATIVQALSGKQNNNSKHLCSRRNPQAAGRCGRLETEFVDLLFDASKFRLDLFVHSNYRQTQTLQTQRYLPPATDGWAMLNNLNLNASGQDGNHRFALSSESYLSYGETRLQARYGLTNGGATLYEASIQFDEADREAEVGSFRTSGRNSSFISDANIVGVRIATSTKTRVDLDNALGTPLLVFLNRRSRVDLIRQGELLDSRFYDAGNQQLDTSRLPNGSYQLTIKTVDVDGREQEQTQFFVRSAALPPKGEPQHYFEMGALTDPTRNNSQPDNGGWARLGSARRLGDLLAVEGEVLHARDVNYATGGAYLFAPGWQVHLGAMHSSAGDRGMSLRGNLTRGTLNWSFDYLRIDAHTPDPTAMFDGVINSSYVQSSSTLSFPLHKGQGFIRARLSKANNGRPQKGIGFSYLGPLFQHKGLLADFTLDSNFGNNTSWLRLGFTFRWRKGDHYTSAAPQVQWTEDAEQGRDRNGFLDARWTHNQRSQRYGELQQGAYALRDANRSIFGARLANQSRYGFADIDVAHEHGSERSGLNYSTNSRFSLVTKKGKTALGGGRNELAALVVKIDGYLPDAEFQILVDGRVAGYVRAGKRGVVSLRPYQTYKVSVQPTGNAIYNYDQTQHQVSLYPGNVEQLSFNAHSVQVIVGQAVFADGSPVANARISTADGHGATDANGWFQLEVSDLGPVPIQFAPNKYCSMPLPQDQYGEDLQVFGALECLPIQAPPKD